MSILRTHTIELSVDSTYLVVKDTTPLANYTDAGISDPVSEVDDIELRITDEYTNTTTTVDLTANAADLRDTNGLKVYSSIIGLGDTFKDDVWDSEIDWVFNPSIDTNTSTSTDILYSDVKNEVAKAVAIGDWKDAFNYRSKQTYSKRALQMKSWIDQLENANNNNLINEGRSILNSLKSIL